MKRLLLMSLTALVMIGCTNKESVPIEIKFPRLQNVEINSSICIPYYSINRNEIAVKDENVTMGVETFRKIKEGDALKVKYLLKRLRLFIFGLNVMNKQVNDFNEEFVDAIGW